MIRYGPSPDPTGSKADGATTHAVLVTTATVCPWCEEGMRKNTQSRGYGCLRITPGVRQGCGRGGRLDQIHGFPRVVRPGLAGATLVKTALLPLGKHAGGVLALRGTSSRT